jgi:phosphate uptake regulator
MKVRRKIQKIGGSFYLNLPMKWITDRNISENSEMELVVLQDGGLKVAPEVQDTPTEIEENVFLPPEKYVARQIVRKCLTGAETITVVSQEPIPEEIRNDIYRFMKRLPSAEIIDETETSIKIQNFRYSSIPTVQAIKRMYQLCNQMFTNLIKNNYTNIEDYVEEIDRFFIVVIIHIRRFLSHDIFSISPNGQEFTPIEALDFRMLVENIQRISKLIHVILDLQKDAPFDPVISSYGGKVNVMFEGAMKSFFESDSDLACQIWEQHYALRDEECAILANVQSNRDRSVIYNLMRIKDYSKRIADLVP